MTYYMEYDNAMSFHIIVGFYEVEIFMFYNVQKAVLIFASNKMRYITNGYSIA